ncbi:hypothetical protein INT48_003282 [Thamnidium elegans]|uniref:Uncharacterized protein n=1 Tax=Thamnidium elegans TaxID=101142 RepID=A0A8H7SY49_9FUNG|nr:hypothetical protein INT48_003282 [Thamnidium elegans]
MKILQLTFNGFTQSVFGSCVYGYQDAFSIFLGYASIFCWLNAQVPQMMENYKLKSADGLSSYLLYFWLAGDLGNMFSCVLNHQLPFQIYLACYFVMTDIILLFQYFHYGKGDIACTDEIMKISDDDEEATFTRPMTDISSSASNYGSTDNKTTTAFMGLLLFGCKLGLGSTNALTTDTGTIKMQDYDSHITIGWLLAWMCTAFYLVSRVPQIIKNYKRQSTLGLSLALFNFSVGGNMTYAASILLHPGHTRHTFLEALPYLAGSVGTLFLDSIIFAQFMYYRKNTNSKMVTILSRVPTSQ